MQTLQKKTKLLHAKISNNDTNDKPNDWVTNKSRNRIGNDLLKSNARAIEIRLK